MASQGHKLVGRKSLKMTHISQPSSGVELEVGRMGRLSRL